MNSHNFNVIRWIILIFTTVVYGIPVLALNIIKGFHPLMTIWGIGMWIVGIVYFVLTRK